MLGNGQKERSGFYSKLFAVLPFNVPSMPRLASLSKL